MTPLAARRRQGGFSVTAIRRPPLSGQPIFTSYMPIYEYRADDGEMIEEFRSMNAEHPETIERDGKLFHRVYGNHYVNGMEHVTYPYASKVLAGTEAGRDCRAAVVPVGRKGHKARLPIVESPQHERNLMAKHGLERE